MSLLPPLPVLARPPEPAEIARAFQARLDTRVDADLFAHCARLAADAAGLRTAADFARVLHGAPRSAIAGPAPSAIDAAGVSTEAPTLDEALRGEHPRVARALEAVAREMARLGADASAVLASQCRLLAFWELLAVAQPLGRWIRYGMPGGEPLVSLSFVRACGTARLRVAGRPRFAFQSDELAAHAIGFERMGAHRRLQ